MADLPAQVWATPGLGWLVLTISLAGLVRGFTGFGTGLIFVPVAGIFLVPHTVIGVIVLTGVFAIAALIPRAWAQAKKREVGTLALAAVITVPPGLYLLTLFDATAIRWIVAAVAGSTLAALVSGRRFDGRVGPKGLLAIGAAAGLIGGLTGITGPVVIMFYLAGRSAVQTVRANTILFLSALDFAILGNLLFTGSVGLYELALAVTLAIPYFVTSLIGQSLFDPKFERLYRWAAYAVIGLAVLSGLPVWS